MPATMATHTKHITMNRAVLFILLYEIKIDYWLT